MNEHNNYNYYNCNLDENTINSDYHNYNVNYSRPSNKNKIQQNTKLLKYKDVKYNNKECIR